MPPMIFPSESLKTMGWIAIRLRCPPRHGQLGSGRYWAWLIPPLPELRAALGIAWGRRPWEDEIANGIANGMMAEFFNARGASPNEPSVLDHLTMDYSDSSLPPQYTKHAFDPLRGRAPTNAPAIAWATLELSPHRRAPHLGPARTFARLDAILRSWHPEAKDFGPFPERPYALGRQHCSGGFELAALVPQALALMEARAIGRAAPASAQVFTRSNSI